MTWAGAKARLRDHLHPSLRIHFTAAGVAAKVPLIRAPHTKECCRQLASTGAAANLGVAKYFRLCLLPAQPPQAAD